MSESDLKRLFPTPAHWVLERRRLIFEGMHDAFLFALKHDSEQIDTEINQALEAINDPWLLEGPMKPGAGPRIYKDGYLAGLREALDIITKHAEQQTTYAAEQPKQRDHVVAENPDSSYQANDDDRH